MEMETKTLTNKNQLSLNYDIVKTLIKSTNLSEKELFDKLKFYGFNNFLINYNDAVSSEVRSKILSSGMAVSSVFYEGNLQNKGDYFKELEIIDFCYYNKVKKLALLINLPKENQPFLEYLFNVKQNLRSIVKYAKTFGVKVSVLNNLTKTPFCDLSFYKDLLKSVKGLKMTFNAPTFYLTAQNPIECYNALKDYVLDVCVFDASFLNESEFKYTALGNGNTDVLNFVRYAIDDGYNGEFFVSRCPQDCALEFLRESSINFYVSKED